MSSPSWKTRKEIKERSRPKTGTPPMFNVYLLNDDYTTMDFVVEILKDVFGKPPMEATRVMLLVHREGKGLAGVYTRDIAETKISIVHTKAQENGFPLKCDMEKT